MPESKSSDPAGGSIASKPADTSTFYVAAGVLLLAVGAGLFHPGAGLILAGLALTCVGIFGAPRQA